MLINIFTPNKQRYNLLEDYTIGTFDYNYCNSINEIKNGVVIIDDDYTIENAFQLCEVLVKNKSNPLIMISYQTSVINECMALEIGCIDYVKAPFSLEILALRIKRTFTDLKNDLRELEIATDTFLNKGYRQVILLDQEISLTSKQYDILLYLVNKANIIVSREELINEVWHQPSIVNARNVDAHIKNIRKLLPNIKIDTINRGGYRFNK